MGRGKGQRGVVWGDDAFIKYDSYVAFLILVCLRFEVDDTPPDSHCEVCDPWEGGKDPWIRNGAIEQQQKTTMFSPIPPRLSPEELVQLNKWLATPISTPALTRPPLPSTPTSTKSVFVLAGDCCDVVTDWDGFKSVDIDFEVVMGEVVDNVGEVLGRVEGNLLNDDEPSLLPLPASPSPFPTLT